MGIPAYYKKLVDTVNGLVLQRHPDETVDWLFMDFNCLIYHCLHQKDMPVYSDDMGAYDKEMWEAEFMERIVHYALRVIHDVHPSLGVYLAIDGVVPMAKMRQQRLRRFKSSWIRQNQSWLETSEQVNSWDTNAVTPGTNFMKKLRTRLEKMMKEKGHGTWKFSSSDEPGEGEHKIMAQWRTGAYHGNIAVYGLDADLVVLSLLNTITCPQIDKIWLFREEMQSGSMVMDKAGLPSFEWFSIHALSQWLSAPIGNVEKKKQFILQYCFTMSILGNDFLPSSLGLKMRDDGHMELLTMLYTYAQQDITLISSTDYSIQHDGLKALFSELTSTEAIRIQKYIQKKLRHAQHTSDLLLMGQNNWPLSHVEEAQLMQGNQLSPRWQITYMTQFLKGLYKKEIMDTICKEYLYGIQWIWSYYLGKDEEVCFDWFYPYSLPPLWTWIRDVLDAESLPSFPNRVYVTAKDICPVEQLALVLPLSSWNLIPVCKEKQLPLIAPHLFPTTFTFESVGKRYFWECEACIPIPTIRDVKQLIRKLKH
jgi:5'-3' exonuclease